MSSSLNCKESTVLVDYLHEQVLKLQETVKRLRDIRETELDSGFRSQRWGTTAC